MMITIYLAGLSLAGQAQNKRGGCLIIQDSILHKPVYVTLDEMPGSVGGWEALHKILTKYFRYPPGNSDHTERVIIAFVVEPNGAVDGKRVIRDPSVGKQAFGSQLLKIVDKINWKPGKCKGKLVPALYFLPIMVDLE